MVQTAVPEIDVHLLNLAVVIEISKVALAEGDLDASSTSRNDDAVVALYRISKRLRAHAYKTVAAVRLDGLGLGSGLGLSLGHVCLPCGELQVNGVSVKPPVEFHINIITYVESVGHKKILKSFNEECLLQKQSSPCIHRLRT